jgi:hypothetical protein
VGGVGGLLATTVPPYDHGDAVQHWCPVLALRPCCRCAAALIAHPDASIGMHAFGHPAIIPFLMKSPFAHLLALLCSLFYLFFSSTLRS